MQDPQQPKPFENGSDATGAMVIRSDQITIARAFENWAVSAQGQYLLQWEQQQLDLAVANLFGYNAVQVGLPQLSALRENRMQTKTVLQEPSLSAHETTSLVSADRINRVYVAELCDLPFASESIDLIVLPHLLETCPQPHALLREIDRVLRPEGRLIVTGCNPISLWGLGRTSPRVQWIGPTRLRDWLKLLSFENDQTAYGCFKPPFQSHDWLVRMSFLESAGDRWWPVCGAVYLHCAVKKVHNMHLVGPDWKSAALRGKARPVAATSRQG